MNIVLYSAELEPITVMWLPIKVQKGIIHKGFGVVTVRDENDKVIGHVNVRPYKLISPNDKPVTVFWTHEEELALGMLPAYLPGQTSAVRSMFNILKEQRNIINKLKK